MIILAASEFIPLVALAGHPIAIHVHTDHDDARLAAAALRLLLADKGIALDLEVPGVHIDHGMVKSHDDVATIAAE